MVMFVSGYPWRSIVIWIALLALTWLALFSPWTPGWNGAGAALIVLTTSACVAIATLGMRERRASTHHILRSIDEALASLPSDIKRNTPLILTVGDVSSVLSSIFDKSAVMITEAAIWVRHDDPSKLMHLADAIKRWRGGQGPDAVAWLMAADDSTSTAALQATLKRWRAAINQASRAVGYRLPVCVALYGAEAADKPLDCPWFGVSGCMPLDPRAATEQISASFGQFVEQTRPADRQSRASTAAQLDALARWACETALQPLLDTRQGTPALTLNAFGVTAVARQSGSDSLYGKFLAATTALDVSARESMTQRYQLPLPLIRGIAPQPRRRVLPLALAHAFAWLALWFCAAAAASAWQNRTLVVRVAGHVTRYQAIPQAQDAARVDALAAIKRDRDQLERYASAGVPPRLGLGFYHGGSLLPLVNRLIADYRPPAPAPSTIELDSLSLFDSGSSKLKPGSNRILIGALEMIKVHPNKRVLIAGHTDSIGNKGSNLSLSEARAVAVRDWLADAAGLSITRFAIQGYGDTRPKASNDREEGRAENRRVEITLVPDCRDDRGNGFNPGQPACF
ncbi:Outer membrane protein OmpA [Paraburkholderia sabiae]|nr:OmpA family protein [Paraburkholderia sabiae]CAG9218638.1 Outer membrane protein OmpA [Paraburkholderia sabiae]